jgi:AbiTii
MSLLREIQNELARSDADVVAVLRKCKILAARLKSAEFAKWVDWEIGGYPEDQALPEYRKLRITYFANFMNIAWKVNRAPVPIQLLPEKIQDGLREVEFRDGIAKVASFARATGTLAVEQPALPFVLQGEMYPDMECHRVWGETSPTEFEQVLSAVTSRILDFVLKLEAENPEAGEAPPNAEPVPREKLAPLVQNIFYGNVGNIAQNSDKFTQNSSVGISPTELLRFVTEFTNHLSELGLDQRQRQRAEAQIAALKAESASEPDSAIVKQAALTLRNITEGTIAGLVTAAVQPTVWTWIHQMLKALSQ